MVDNDLFLFIEPQKSPSVIPIIDDITKKMVYQFRNAKSGLERAKDSKKEYFFNESIRWRELVIELPWNKKYDFQLDSSYRGFHICSCGAVSGACNYLIPEGEIINSLCIHYLAFHREEVPQEQLDKISKWSLFDFKDLIPEESELIYPKKREVISYA